MYIAKFSVEGKGHLAKIYLTNTFENFLKISIKFARRL